MRSGDTRYIKDGTRDAGTLAVKTTVDWSENNPIPLSRNGWPGKDFGLFNKNSF